MAWHGMTRHDMYIYVYITAVLFACALAISTRLKPELH